MPRANVYGPVAGPQVQCPRRDGGEDPRSRTHGGWVPSREQGTVTSAEGSTAIRPRVDATSLHGYARGMTPWPHGRGPFRAAQLPEEGRYELSDGHPIECQPAGGQHGGSNLVGSLPLATDPMVREAGVDVGYALTDDTVRAPDIAVGNVPLRRGWVSGAPPLAVEYADRDQDEKALGEKIGQLLSAGTQYVWVVRLQGPRRVEVHEPGKAMQTMLPGQSLVAPGVLQNKVPVAAMYDPQAAREAALNNLLQREGYASLEEVWAEGEAKGRAEGEAKGEARGEAKGETKGKAEGKAEGKREVLQKLVAKAGLALTDDQRTRIAAATDLAALDRWIDAVLAGLPTDDWLR